MSHSQLMVMGGRENQAGNETSASLSFRFKTNAGQDIANDLHYTTVLPFYNAAWKRLDNFTMYIKALLIISIATVTLT